MGGRWIRKASRARKQREGQMIPCAVCGKPINADLAFRLADGKVKCFNCDDPNAYRSVKAKPMLPYARSKEKGDGAEGGLQNVRPEKTGTDSKQGRFDVIEDSEEPV